MQTQLGLPFSPGVQYTENSNPHPWTPKDREAGHLVSVLWERQHPLPPYRTTCVYLKSGDAAGAATLRQQQIEAAKLIPKCNFHFLGGDLNFTTNIEDRSLGSFVDGRAPKSLIRAWNQLAVTHKFEEITQHHHTHYNNSVAGSSLLSSSRLDRVFCAMPPGYSAASTPEAMVVHSAPFTLTTLCIQAPDGIQLIKAIPGKARAQLATDHLPVGVRFSL